MKNRLKVILGTIIGIVLGTSVTVYAYNYQAKDIGFKPTNEAWEVDNVKSAIDELYNSFNKTIKSYQNQIQSQNTEITTLTNKIESLEKEFDDVYKSKEAFSTLLIVDGNVGSIAELHLQSFYYKKFKISSIDCYSGHAATAYTMNSEFSATYNISLNTEYEINNDNYRLYLKKTVGSNSWCQALITFYN